MRRTVYLETTIFSYLASRPSRDVIVAARQQLTHLWWQSRRSVFDLYVSRIVLDEIEAGDSEQPQKRSELVTGLPILDMPSEVADLAAALIHEVPLPPKAGTDAAHIAVAAYHGVDFLLTWNAAHIANAELRPRVEQICRRLGYSPPVLCTPDELMGGTDV
jgi:hypothetical protein